MEDSLTSIESLADDLLFDILLHLPAQDIYNGARFVCKIWHNVIHNRKFIYEHLRHSTHHGLIIRYDRQREHTSFLTMRRGKIEISKFSNYDFKYEFWTSCNGLLLECDRDKHLDPYYIVNPSTNQRLALPPKYYSGIAYAAASMVYKVANPYTYASKPEERGCFILTVGVDKSYRLADTQHLSLAGRTVLRYAPLTTEGFVHWSGGNTAVIVTMNVETEVIREIPVPQGYGEKWKYYLSTETSLTFVTHIKEYSWEVWELRQETGEWTKLPKIELESQILMTEYWKRCKSDPSLVPPSCTQVTVRPVGWLNGREVLVLHAYPTRLCVVYNVRTREIDFFELDHDFDNYLFRVHRNSLVRLDGC